MDKCPTVELGVQRYPPKKKKKIAHVLKSKDQEGGEIAI
jgi:hypothetical protein